jgi:hypothetical protein
MTRFNCNIAFKTRDHQGTSRRGANPPILSNPGQGINLLDLRGDFGQAGAKVPKIFD